MCSSAQKQLASHIQSHSSCARCAGDKIRLGRNFGLIAAAGLCLSGDFFFWVWALKKTSLPHNLFILSSGPPLIAVGSLLLRQPLSKGAACTVVHFWSSLISSCSVSQSLHLSTPAVALPLCSGHSLSSLSAAQDCCQTVIQLHSVSSTTVMPSSWCDKSSKWQ